MDASPPLRAVVRLAIYIFAALVAGLVLINAVIFWWTSTGPGSPCWEVRHAPDAVCGSVLWYFGPSPMAALILAVLFAASMLVAWIWQRRRAR